ncbi:DUF3460 family protein [Neisseria sp. Ec49-e6-T10]|uniref:DUF3460 family protein n=1 Tax=Neisseria sp. Ec49-e6-T10 TaxID=3140744 RepID=UPI003EBAD6FF
MYVSEYTKFMDEFLQKNPDIAQDRLRLRGTLWDVELKPEEQIGFQESRLPNKPYPYQVD